MVDKKQIKVKITLEGTREFSAQLKGLQKSAKDFGKDIQQLGKSVGESAKRIAAFSAATTAAAVGIAKLVKAGDEFAEGLQNISTQTGIATDKLQVWQKVADFSGISPDVLNKGLQDLTKNLGNLRDPTSSANKSLRELSPSLAAFLPSAKNTEEAFGMIRNAILSTSNEVDRINIAQAAFGEAGVQLIPLLAKSGDEWQKNVALIKQYSVVLDDMQIERLRSASDSFNKFGEASGGTVRLLQTALAPAVEALLSGLADVIVQVRGPLTEFMTFLSDEFAVVARDFFKLLSNSPEVDAVDERAQRIYDGFIKIKEAVKNAFQTAVEVIKPFYAILDAVAKAIGMGSGAELGLTLLFLQFTGVLKVAFDAIRVGRGAFKLLFDAIKLGPAALTMLKVAFVGESAIITKAIKGVQVAWVSGVLNMSGVSTSLIGILGKLRVVMAAAWGVATGPIGLVVAGVALLTAGVVWLIEKTIGWGNIWNGIVKIFDSAKQAAGSFFTSVGDFFRGLGGIIADGIKSGINAAIGAFKGATDTFKQFFLDLASVIPEQLANTAKALVSAVGDSLKTLADAIRGTLEFFFGWIGGFIKRISSAIKAVTGRGREAREGSSGDRGQQTPAFATGGPVIGPGTGTSDSILARISNGEYVIRADSVQKYGRSLLDAINSGVLNIKAFASGGMVDLAESMSPATSRLSPITITPGADMGGRPINFYLPGGKVIPARVEMDVAKSLEKQMRNSDMMKPVKESRWNR